MASLAAACLPAACLRATHMEEPRLAQAERRRFDFPVFGPGEKPCARGFLPGRRGMGQGPPEARSLGNRALTK